MPAWGLIPDSPIFYYAGKGLKTRSRRRPRASYGAEVNFTYTFGNVVLYKPILNYELNVQGGMVGRHLQKIGAKIVAGARSQVGVRTGRLRTSIHMTHHTEASGQYIKVGSRLSYAYLHHEGTKPHIITPNPPNTTLRFSKGARIIQTTVVRHPGTKPNRYLSNQLRRFVR